MSEKEQRARDKFAHKVIDAMQRKGVIPSDDSVVYEAAHFRVRIGASRYLNFGNFYAEYERAGFFGRRKVLRNNIAQLSTIVGVGEIPKVFADAAANVLPRLRDRSFWDRNRRKLATSFDEAKPRMPAYLRSMYGVFDAELVYDLPEAVMTVSNDHLEGWGKTFDEVWPIAIENLRNMSNKPFARNERGLYVSTWQDSHDATRLLLPELVRKLPVQGHYLAMAPNRDLLMVADSNDEVALLEMAMRTRAMMDEPRFLSATLLRLVGDTWQPHTFAAGHQLREQFEQLARLHEARDYNDQKEGLQAEVGEAAFVATLSAFVRSGDSEDNFRTYATWTKTVVTLLPKSDFVMFIDLDGDNEPMRVAWADAHAVVGAMMKPYGCYPERYQVDDFPSEAQLAELRQRVERADAEAGR